jgi:putative spermidine/putrescine transport system permease protein
MRDTLYRLIGWSALAVLLAPLVLALWISFSPDALLRPPVNEWSLRWYRQFFDDPRWRMALVNSLVVGALSVLVALASGVPFTLALVRYRFAGRGILSLVVLAPLCVPPLILGVGLLPLMHRVGLWGTWLSLALAHGLLGLPIVYLATRVALEGVPAGLEDAARGLGAGPWQVFRRVTLPLVGPGVTAGAVLAFVLSLNESLMTLFLASPETETLARIIWPELRYSLSPLVAVASALTLAATLSVALLARRIDAWLRQRWYLGSHRA